MPRINTDKGKMGETMADKKTETIRSKIWEEIPEEDNPFAAKACYCSGYDVYGDILPKASWSEYLYLLFKRERPAPAQAKLLEKLAIALANPGPRDHSIHAAMCGGVGGSTYAACLMAALGVGAGQLGGAHEVAIAMDCWMTCGQDLGAWRERLSNPPRKSAPTSGCRWNTHRGSTRMGRVVPRRCARRWSIWSSAVLMAHSHGWRKIAQSWNRQWNVRWQ